MIQRAKQFGIKFNKDKLQYKVNKVKYLGQIFTKQGVSPDPDQVEAINRMEEPKNKKELLRFLGCCNYLMKFIPNLSKLTELLRSLLKN